MKVLIELDSNDVKIGAVNDVLDLARYSKGHNIEYYLAGPLNDELVSAAKNCGMKLIALQSKKISKLYFLSYIFSVIRWVFIIKKISPDIIHLNYISWAPSLGMAAHLYGLPVVARAGGSYNPGNLTHRWVAKYIANCTQQGEALLDSPVADKVVVAGDLINIERFNDIKAPAPPYPEKSEGIIRFLFLGQLVERKGLDFLVQAFSNVPKNSELLLVGGNWASPGFPQKIKHLIEELNLSDRIHCLNHREDAMALMNDCDIFVLPSLSEARPRSIIEAMLMGKCVLATEVGGIPSLIQSGETGLLVQAKDSLSLGKAMEQLIIKNDLRSKLSTRAKKYAQEAFDPLKTAKNYIDIYASAISEKKQESI